MTIISVFVRRPHTIISQCQSDVKYTEPASDPFVIALGKKNAAILAEQEMLDKAERAGVPAALDCIGIYTKPCHDNGMSAAIPHVSISTVHDSSIPNLCVFG
ncbi:MAG: hypothetical protein WA323_15190 [Candidatus Nitrosopolaris sp.]